MRFRFALNSTTTEEAPVPYARPELKDCEGLRA